MNPIDLCLQATGCSQAEFARLMGVSGGLVSMWKVRGYITQKYLAKAADVTGLPAHLLNPYVPIQRREESKPSEE